MFPVSLNSKDDLEVVDDESGMYLTCESWKCWKDSFLVTP